MSKLSFRARALDASKPLPVFRCEDLPDLHEYASINRAVPQMPTGMEKEEESVCFFIADRLTVGSFGCVFLAGSAAMLPAQACAKWPPCLLIRAHDGSRWRPNITESFDRWCRYKVPAVGDFIRKLGCVRQICLGMKSKAQRKSRDFYALHHFVDFSFWWRPQTACSSRELLPGGDTGPSHLLGSECSLLTAPVPPCVLHVARSASVWHSMENSKNFIDRVITDLNNSIFLRRR